MKLRIKRFDQKFPLPAPTEGAACFDLLCRETVTIPPHAIKAVPQNVAVQVPHGYVFLLFTRSSTPLRKGVMLANSVGVIDPFYRGDKDEVLAMLLNITDKEVTIEAGDLVVQGMILKTEPVEWDEAAHFNDEGHGGYNHAKYLK